MNYAAEHIAETGLIMQSWLHYSCLFGFAAQDDLVALLLVTLITAALAATIATVLRNWLKTQGARQFATL